MAKAKATLGGDLLAKKGAGAPVGGVPQRAPATEKKEEVELVALNFRVAKEFRKEWHMYARESDRTGVEILAAAFEALKEKEAQEE